MRLDNTDLTLRCRRGGDRRRPWPLAGGGRRRTGRATDPRTPVRLAETGAGKALRVLGDRGRRDLGRDRRHCDWIAGSRPKGEGQKRPQKAPTCFRAKPRSLGSRGADGRFVRHAHRPHTADPAEQPAPPSCRRAAEDRCHRPSPATESAGRARSVTGASRPKTRARASAPRAACRNLAVRHRARC